MEIPCRDCDHQQSCVQRNWHGGSCCLSIIHFRPCTTFRVWERTFQSTYNVGRSFRRKALYLNNLHSKMAPLPTYPHQNMKLIHQNILYEVWLESIELVSVREYFYIPTAPSNLHLQLQQLQQTCRPHLHRLARRDGHSSSNACSSSSCFSAQFFSATSIVANSAATRKQ